MPNTHTEDLDETAYLLRSPANARRLLEAVNRARRQEAGVAFEVGLEQLEIEFELREVPTRGASRF